MRPDAAMDRRIVVPVRTELQIAPFEGPTGIKPAERRFVTNSDDPTPRLAVPADWTKRARCLNDWKAFAAPGDDMGRVEREPSPTVSARLCGRGTDNPCPVLEVCLSTALEEEGTASTAFRAGVRGGLNPAQRYKRALETSEDTCPAGHLRSEHSIRRPDDRWECQECKRIREEREVVCSCGHRGQWNSIRVHQRRKGCSGFATVLHAPTDEETRDG